METGGANLEQRKKSKTGRKNEIKQKNWRSKSGTAEEIENREEKRNKTKKLEEQIWSKSGTAEEIENREEKRNKTGTNEMGRNKSKKQKQGGANYKTKN